jgi:hypothetical protein
VVPATAVKGDSGFDFQSFPGLLALPLGIDREGSVFRPVRGGGSLFITDWNAKRTLESW